MEFAAAGRLTEVPEFHDCQRFILPNGTYGPLIAIFAAWELGWLNAYLDSIQEGTNVTRALRYRSLDSARAAAAGAPPRAATPAPQQSAGPAGAASPAGSSAGNAVDTRAAAVAALIVNMGDRYESDGLVIENGYSCLFLWRNRGWSAVILPVSNERVCLEPLGLDSLNASAGRLKVVEDRPKGHADPDYPAVARWDYDEPRKHQYIGIRCGAAWCEIGGRNFSPSAPHTGPFPAMQNKVARIKGWYDQQFLAVIDPTGPRPSRLLGTIVPHPDLDGYVDTDFADTWAPVAYVAIQGNAPAADYKYYKTKLNLDRAPMGNNLERLNTLALCYGTKQACGLPNPMTPTCNLPATDFETTRYWWGRINSVGGDTMYKCITEEDHENMGFHVIGTARWRWVLEDETSWTRCIEGCCEMHQTAT